MPCWETCINKTCGWLPMLLLKKLDSIFSPRKHLGELLIWSKTNWLELLIPLKQPSWDNYVLKTSYLRIFSSLRCQPFLPWSPSLGCQPLESEPGLLQPLRVWLIVQITPSFSLTYLDTFQSPFSTGEGDIANRR